MGAVCGVRTAEAEYHLPDYRPNANPNTQTAARPPKGEGEAARNNVVMSAGKCSCPDMICYLCYVGALSSQLGYATL